MRYLIYDPATRALTGAFLQDLQPAHADCYIEVDEATYDNWHAYRLNVAGDGVEPLPPVADAPALPTVAEYRAAIQAMLDTKAQERNYDGILSACTYATSTVPRFQAEGQACVAWRDAVWSTAYALMAQVEAGELAQPTLAGILALLPPMAWPA
jgi:hypothetical protein